MRATAIVALACAVACVHGFAQSGSLRVGTVLDGDSASNREFRTAVQAEASRLLGTQFDISFPDGRQLVGDWTADAARRNIESLLADERIDAVLVLGIVGPSYVTRRPELPKPVVAAVVADPATGGIPVEYRERARPGQGGVERVRTSGVPNLSYIARREDLVREVETFREIAAFSRLAILMIDAIEKVLPTVRSDVARALAGIGVESTLIPVGPSVEPALEALPDEIEAVMLGPLPQLDASGLRRLTRALHARKLPTYSLNGASDVRNGALASLKTERNELSLVRRVSLNLFNILRGEEAAGLPVDFTVDEQLTINMATARRLGVDPTFAQLTEAELVGDSRMPATRRISLADVVREAEQVNLDLAAAERRVAAGLQQVRQARASLLPQASVSSQATFIDRDRASVLQGERQVSGGLGLQQLIYSEPARSGYDIERQLQIAREEDRFKLRLDVVLDAAAAYLDVLRAKTVENVQQENLAITRSNLGLARARVDVGAAGRDEVLRWRSQLAQDRRNLIEAAARRSQAEIAVNRILNRSLEESFDTVEVGLDDPGLTVNFEALRPFVESPGVFTLFREFMAREALDASPEIRSLDAAIRAQERSLLAARRLFYVPTVGTDARLESLRNGGEPALAPVGGPDGVNWSVALQATLPIFQGGALRAQRARAEIELDRFTIDREAARLLVSQRIRAAMLMAGSSFAGIDLARESAEAAQENLGLVREAYSAGSLGIVRVLDAQAQALSAELDAASVVFGHLIDLMQVQRAVGRFDYFRSPDERAELIRRLEVFVKERGYETRRR